MSLPHTETTSAFSYCAFTMKAMKFATMMHRQGYDVRLYASEVNEAECTEHIPLITRAEQAEWFPDYNPARDVWDDFDPSKPHWQAMNERAVAAIRERAEPGDVFCMTMGLSQQPVALALSDLGLFNVETGIGYTGVWAPFRVFESYAWMAYLAGKGNDDDVRFYHDVIPNYWDTAEFPLGRGDGGYFLYMGRFIRRKGVEIAMEATRRLGAPLVMAGQGVIDQTPGRFVGIDVVLEGDHLSHVGVVGPEERARLMGGAIAVFCPSIYLEPFCGTHVEAMLCGTPVITTDWGVFPETVIDDFTGYRCHTLAEFVQAGRDVESLDRGSIREHARATWGLEPVGRRYDRFFRRLQTLNGAGWYEREVA